MEKLKHLLAQKSRLQATMQMMDTNAQFYSEDGRRYAHALVRLVLINMQIEEIEKEAAH
ncbi:hypothetical protein FHR92_002444 [Fontibacillus solani]|uniref:Uncharacterized protein n=1 Tax=Fontibacillus solani TaxID=1572857 RepID=A0A7W3STP5_9BACL|nr:hypothetical protein [Fontibacillus solani]MBA9085972.1 hypothetical protein [Fontibacillus solani]